jgi:DnaJ family protein C protein 8
MSDPVDALKAEGNAYFAKGEHASAVASYTAALAACGGDDAGGPSAHPQKHVLLSNRAAAYLGRGAPGDALLALSDASASLRLQPNFARAQGRKGAALLALGQPGPALAAYQAACRLEPESAALRAGLDAAQAQLARERAVAAEAAAASSSASAAAAAAPAAAREEDALSSFLSDVGSLAATAAERERELARTHAPPSLAREAISAAEAAGFSGGGGGGGGAPRLLTDGAAGGGAPLTTAMVLDRWAVLDAGGEEEAAERARSLAEAIARVSTGREYELRGEAAAAQSAALAAADLGGGDAQAARLTAAPHAAWLNLNPFEVLQLPHTATEEDIKGRYRRISALVHPDKCAHAAANDAFQAVKAAYDALLEPNKRRIAAGLVDNASKGAARERRAREAKLRAAGLFADLAALPPLAEAARTATRKAFAEAEHRRVTYEARVKATAAREAEAAAEAHEKQVEAAKADVAWAEGGVARMEKWQAFEGALAAGAKKRRRVDGGEEEEEEKEEEGGGGEEGAAAAAAAAAPAGGDERVGGGATGGVRVRVSAAMRYGAAALAGPHAAGGGGGGGGGDAPAGDVDYKKRWR